MCTRIGYIILLRCMPVNRFIISPVRKYKKSYCNHPGFGVGVRVRILVRVRVRVAQMLKFFIKVFISLYLLNFFMDQVDTLHVDRYSSAVLFCTIMTHLGDIEVNFVLQFCLKVLSVYIS